MHENGISLLEQAWLPVRRGSGARGRVRPAEIAGGDDPAVAFSFGRPDLDAAARELLIALLSTACWDRLGSWRRWQGWFAEPPEPADLDAAFAPFAQAFRLDGEGPRFMQDLEPLPGEPIPIAWLLIGAPTDNTLGENKDLFVKRGGIGVLGAGTAAMALFALQTFAPSGGRGNLTSLRGGGPMTTLVLPPEQQGREVPLWQQLWLNTFRGSEDEGWTDPREGPGRLMPWLVPTRSRRKTTAADVHPATCFWGMPRRIRLDVQANEAGVPCDLTGVVEPFIVRSWRQRPDGNDYKAWPKAHPLTPYYEAKAKGGVSDWLAVHPQPGRLGFSDWVGLVVADADGSKTPAAILKVAAERLEEAGTKLARLLVSGFDMDNMKARGFVESRMPLLLPQEARRQGYETLIRQLVGGAREAVAILGTAVRLAVHGANAKAPKEGGAMTLARNRLWDGAEPGFHAALASVLEAGRGDDAAWQAALAEAPQAWQASLRRLAVELFDSLVPMDGLEERAMERLVGARRFLTLALAGYGKMGSALFTALGLPPPEVKARAATARTRKAA